MGLDMYAYCVDPDDVINDFGFRLNSTTQFFYWRKHPNLHGLMEGLWRERVDILGTQALDEREAALAREEREDEVELAASAGEPAPAPSLAAVSTYTLESLTFNCEPLRLYEQDLQCIEEAIKGGSLPDTIGFFFGESERSDEQQQEDLAFVEQAREHIREGKAVYYNSWW